VANLPEVTKKLGALGFEPANEPNSEFAKVVRHDYVRWGEYIKKANIKVE
jgi:tripartite-type tricarboxylate transporter receptor subunit TctC